MCGGGGGTTANTVSEFKPPEWLQAPWQQYVTSSANYATKPYTPFDGMKVAPINGRQTLGMQFLEDRAVNGAPDINAARGAAMNLSKGNYASPWAQNISGVASGQAYNPYSEGLFGLSQKSNPNASDAYTKQIIDDTAAQMETAYANGTAAQTDASWAQDGAYGGSAYKQIRDQNAAGLVKQVGQMTSQTLQEQQRFKSGVYNSDYQNMLASLGLGTQMYQGDVGNQIQANAQGAGIWNSDVANMTAGAGLAGQLSQEDWTAGKALTGIGDAYQQYQQQLLSQQYADWQAAQNYPAQMLDIYGNAISRASGSFGTSSAQQAQTLPPFSPITGLLGLGATAYGMTR